MILRIEITVTVPSDVSLSEAVDWVKFELQKNNSLSISNPLSDKELKAETIEISILR